MIQIKNVNMQYNVNQKIFQDLSINFDNKFYAIMGSSGSGKTTLLNIMSGLLKAKGDVLINDTNILELKEPILTKFRSKNISYIFQDYSLIEYLNVYENVILLLKINKVKINNKKIDNILKEVGLFQYKKKFAYELSGGQKQRVAIARSIISPSKIIFADEPTGALDIASRASIMKLLEQMVSKFNKTLIMVTHDPIAASYADEVIFLANGKLNEKIVKASSVDITNKLITLENVKNV